ncbi:helix-turn-helix domain-containing protein [Luteibacter yeojuensis]|uniref:DNA-3-methyladenine glycosylase II n=1 Tax=Luteibacter yeojuensis TaxID=345309 RepID=A0A7X5QW95_9GAMM|nr:helix-turn-helix domain-containing protein [Luteibacter yeojuensis]
MTDTTLPLFNRLKERLASSPASLPSIPSLASAAGLSEEETAALVAEHAQLKPAAWMERERIGFATRLLLDRERSATSIAESAGFATDAGYQRAFKRRMAMTPGDYREALRTSRFQLRLPRGYRKTEVLAYQGRDPQGLAERVEGACIHKALMTADGPAILHLDLSGTHVDASIDSTRKLGRHSVAKLHMDALKILGLTGDAMAFEQAHPGLVEGRRGLRVPLISTAFDALCWAIVGQQINLAFAGSLRRHLIEVAGTPVGSMKVHPTPEAIARLDPSDLTSQRFSRAKTKYLLAAAQAVASGALEIEDLWRGSAIEAEARLTAQHGVGVWTARYVLMRIGFGDSAPVGDSGLATALQRLHGLAYRPDATETAKLMDRYAPWRSLASMHLWASLHG